MGTRNVTIHGRLTADPDFDTKNELAKFTVAVDDGYKKDYTHFFDVVAWKKRAETVVNNFQKGKEIIVTGQLQQERWENEEGKTRSMITINLESFDFCGKKGD